jgi:hypothetical protein
MLTLLVLLTSLWISPVAAMVGPNCADSHSVTDPWDTLAAQAIQQHDADRALKALDAEIVSLHECAPADAGWYAFLLSITSIQRADVLSIMGRGDEAVKAAIDGLSALQKQSGDPHYTARIAALYDALVTIVVEQDGLSLPASLLTLSAI